MSPRTSPRPLHPVDLFRGQPGGILEGLLDILKLPIRKVRKDLLASGTVAIWPTITETEMRMPWMQARPPRTWG